MGSLFLRRIPGSSFTFTEEEIKEREKRKRENINVYKPRTSFQMTSLLLKKFRIEMKI